MKPIYHVMWICAVLIAVFFTAPLSSQPADATYTTEGGVTASYPSAWEAAENSPLTLVLTDQDGWTITISVGEAALYNFNSLEADTSADIVLSGFIDFLKLAGNVIEQETPEAVRVGNLPALKQTSVATTGVPFEIVAFNLPDGTAVLSFVGKQGDTIPPTPEVLDVFYDVLASVRFTEANSADTETDLSPTEEVYIPDGAVIVADLEPGILRFEEGIETVYPEGWSIYTEYPYIESSATLFYGESFDNFEAFMLISVQDVSELSIETFRTSIMSMTAMVYTGREDYDPERDILSETLSDDRVIQYLDVSEAEALMGNTFIIPLDARYWVWASLTTIPTETDPALRTEEAFEIVRSLTFAPQEGTFTLDGYHLIMEKATCELVLNTSHVNQSVPYALFECPANCTGSEYEVWGSDIYTLDSSLCAAAIHTGAITDAEGGTVLTTWLPGQESYAGTEQNGISTMEYGAWGDSFKVEPFTSGNE